MHAIEDIFHTVLKIECVALSLLVCRPPAFGLTAAYAIALGIGGETPAGGRGRVVPKMAASMDSTVAGERDAAGSGSQTGSDVGDSDVVLPPVMAPQSTGNPPAIVSEDTVVAVVMDRLDALAASRAGNNGGEIQSPEGVRI